MISPPRISPPRSISRMATAVALAASLAMAPSLANAQSLIRDTEIEEILFRDSAPILEAAGIDSKSFCNKSSKSTTR